MQEQLVISEIDIENLQNDRQVNTSFMHGTSTLLADETITIPFVLSENSGQPVLTPSVDPHPFTSSGDALKERCEEIFQIQVAGLAKRIVHTHSRTAVVVLRRTDSTLALLVTVMTFDALNIPATRYSASLMPGFGTTDRTYTNACDLIRSLGVTLKGNLHQDACLQHFKDISHNPSVHDVTYENSQPANAPKS